MNAPGLRFDALGEAAVTVTLDDRIAPEPNERVRRLAAAVRAAGWPFVREVVPAYAALTVFYDPLRADYPAVVVALSGLAAGLSSGAEPGPAREVVIPVRYDGPDLAWVAARTGLPEEAVVARHCAPSYRVYLTGFVPGFAYLGPLDPALVVPRRPVPRPRVPAGSVAIGGAQTAVYPLETPGGWHLIGRTDAVLFDPHRTPAALLAPGDHVRFREE